MMQHNPLGYSKIVVVKLVAGVQMLSSYNNYPLQAAYTRQEADERIAQINGFIEEYSQPNHNDCDRPDLLLTPMIRYADDWGTTPLELKSDIARPLRDLFDLVNGATVNCLFIGESVAVLILVAIAMLRGKQIGNSLEILFLLVVSVWSYLVALCLMVLPMRRYTDATSPFVYIALIVGSWELVSAFLMRFGRDWRRASPPRSAFVSSLPLPGAGGQKEQHGNEGSIRQPESH